MTFKTPDLFARLKALMPLVILLFVSPVAHAQISEEPEEPEEIQAFGHAIRLAPQDSEMSISVDGKELYREAILRIEKQLTIDGVGVVIGFARTGGAACEEAPFLISFPQGKEPRFDGPVSPCVASKMTTTKSAVLFETGSFAGNPGGKWQWTPSAGLKAQGQVIFSSPSSGGWEALQARKIKHPHDLLDYRDMVSLLRKRVGSHWREVVPAMSGPGDVTYDGKFVVAHACEAHACGDRRVLFVVDLSQKEVFAAWQLPEQGDMFASHAEEKWSEGARAALLKWSGIEQ